MTNKDLKSILEKAGYKAFLTNSGKEEMVLAGIPDEESTFKGSSAFHVDANGSRIKLHYAMGQLPLEKEFDNAEELLEFLKANPRLC